MAAFELLAEELTAVNATDATIVSRWEKTIDQAAAVLRSTADSAAAVAGEAPELVARCQPARSRNSAEPQMLAHHLGLLAAALRAATDSPAALDSPAATVRAGADQ